MQSDFVLGKWQKDELPIVKVKIEKCVEIIESFAAIGIEQVMNEVNKLSFS